MESVISMVEQLSDKVKTSAEFHCCGAMSADTAEYNNCTLRLYESGKTELSCDAVNKERSICNRTTKYCPFLLQIS